MKKVLLVSALVFFSLGCRMAASANEAAEPAWKLDVCANRICWFATGERMTAIVPRGIHLPDFFGSCAAEAMLYVLSNQKLNELLQSAKRIELTEVGELEELYVPMFDETRKVRRAKVMVDGKDLADLMYKSGLARREGAESETLSKLEGGLWCGIVGYKTQGAR